MDKILKLTDLQLRNRCLIARWGIIAVITIALAVSACVFYFTSDLKISAIIPIVLVPAINLPITLYLIKYEDEKKRREEKYNDLYRFANIEESDLHFFN